MAQSKPLQGKRWVFTINNPSGAGPLFTELPEKVEYVVWQREKGKEAGTEHYQGFLRAAVNFRRSRVEQILGGHAWCDVAHGTDEQCRAYCIKEATRIQGPWELGEMKVSQQGKRTDLPEYVAWAEKVKAGLPLSRVPAQHLAAHPAGFKLCQSLQKSGGIRNVRVICIQGESGIGKTHWIFKHFPNCIRVHYGNSGPWFEGYDDELEILIDEYKAQFKLQVLLQVLDKYPFRVEQKGTTTWAKWTTVFITCNSGPEAWYPLVQSNNPAEFQALLRRLGRCDMSLYPETDSHWIFVPNIGTIQEQRQHLHDQLRPFKPPKPQPEVVPMDEAPQAPQAPADGAPHPAASADAPPSPGPVPYDNWWEMLGETVNPDLESEVVPSASQAGTVPVYDDTW